MFGIGLPEMIVILAVALIVVGPDKLPDLARSLAKGVFELKKTLNQVKDSLADEDNLIGSVQSDLRKTTDDLKKDLIESDHFTWRDPKKGVNDAYPPDEGTAGAEEISPESATVIDQAEIDGTVAEDTDPVMDEEKPSGENGSPGDDPTPPVT